MRRSVSLRLGDFPSDLNFAFDFEVFEGLRPPFPFPEIDMTSSNGTFGLATRKVPIDATLTYSVVTFGVDLETKSRVSPRIASTDWALIWP